MTYSSRASEHLRAQQIVGSAIHSSKGSRRLQCCRALLEQLDPDKPPVTAQAREFRWQYRALRERVHLYSESLENVNDPEKTSDFGFHKAETAIDLSLRYFQDVLPDESDDDGAENSA